MAQSKLNFAKALRLAGILYALFALVLLFFVAFASEFSNVSWARRTFVALLYPAFLVVLTMGTAAGESRRARVAVGLASGWVIAVSAVLLLGVWEILPARAYAWILLRLDVVLWITAALIAWWFVEALLAWRRLFLERRKSP